MFGGTHILMYAGVMCSLFLIGTWARLVVKNIISNKTRCDEI